MPVHKFLQLKQGQSQEHPASLQPVLDQPVILPHFVLYVSTRV